MSSFVGGGAVPLTDAERAKRAARAARFSKDRRDDPTGTGRFAAPKKTMAHKGGKVTSNKRHAAKKFAERKGQTPQRLDRQSAGKPGHGKARSAKGGAPLGLSHKTPSSAAGSSATTWCPRPARSGCKETAAAGTWRALQPPPNGQRASDGEGPPRWPPQWSSRIARPTQSAAPGAAAGR